MPTDDERIYIGRELKRLREQQGLKQRHIKQKTGLSMGTVQGTEYGKPTILGENLDKYATAVGTTIQQILHPEPLPPPNELLRDLNKEHLAIARLYMKAYKTVRAAVELLLVEDPSRAEITIEMSDLILTVKDAAKRDPELPGWIEFLLSDRSDLVAALARRLSADPAFEQSIRDLLEEPPGRTKK